MRIIQRIDCNASYELFGIVCGECHKYSSKQTTLFDEGEDNTWIPKQDLFCMHCNACMPAGVPIPFIPGIYTPPPEPRYVPKCPTCGSPHITDVSTTSKLVGAFTLGIASKSLGKTKKCKNCGYMW